MGTGCNRFQAGSYRSPRSQPAPRNLSNSDLQPSASKIESLSFLSALRATSNYKSRHPGRASRARRAAALTWAGAGLTERHSAPIPRASRAQECAGAGGGWVKAGVVPPPGSGWTQLQGDNSHRQPAMQTLPHRPSVSGLGGEQEVERWKTNCV